MQAAQRACCRRRGTGGMPICRSKTPEQLAGAGLDHREGNRQAGGAHARRRRVRQPAEEQDEAAIRPDHHLRSGRRQGLARTRHPAERDHAADALQYLCDRGLAAGSDRQSRPCLDRGGRQSRRARRELFFVADGTGGHTFSETYDQHQKDVAKLRGIEKDARTPAAAQSCIASPAARLRPPQRRCRRRCHVRGAPGLPRLPQPARPAPGAATGAAKSPARQPRSPAMRAPVRQRGAHAIARPPCATARDMLSPSRFLRADKSAMALSSMTGFARSHGASGSYGWSWEIKSVNAKGLELRLRLPPGFDAVEVPVRTRAAEIAVARQCLCDADGQARGRCAGGAHQRTGAERARQCDRQSDRPGRCRQAAARRSARPEGRDRSRRRGRNPRRRRPPRKTRSSTGFVEALKGLSEMRRHEGEAIGRDPVGAARRDGGACRRAPKRRPAVSRRR